MSSALGTNWENGNPAPHTCNLYFLCYVVSALSLQLGVHIPVLVQAVKSGSVVSIGGCRFSGRLHVVRQRCSL